MSGFRKGFAMFGNGSQPPHLPDDPQVVAPDTSSLWGNMFGVGPLLKLISDPALGAHAHAMMQAIIEGAQASARTEAKLNALLKALGHEIDNRATALAAPALLGADGRDGAGRPPLASLAPHNGAGGAAASPATDFGPPELRGVDDPPAGDH
jgi:hypothetical protein